MPAPRSSESILDQFVTRAAQLYSLPAVALRVLQLTQNPGVDVDELRRCVESDPAITGKLLRVVNSSLFGISKYVTNVGQAISLLGLHRVKLLVLGFSLPTPRPQSDEADVLDHYWRHALLKSVAARELAETVWHRPGEDAFVAGLLQDIGLLALLRDLGESYVKFLRGVWSAGNDPRDLEAEVLGFDHVQLSVRLMENWGLPPSLREAIAMPRDQNHIASLPPGERFLPQVLDLAELVTRFLIHRQRRWLDRLLDAGTMYNQMSVDQLHSVLAELERKTPELAAALAVPWQDEANYVRLLEEVHRRQAAAIVEVAATLEAVPPTGLEQAIAGLASATVFSLDYGDKRDTGRGTAKRPASSTPATAALEKSLEMKGSPAASSRFSPTRDRREVGGGTDSSPLLGPLNALLANCRQSRSSLSLLLVELDHQEQLVADAGEARLIELVQDIQKLVREATDDRTVVVPIRPGQLGVLLTGYDRHEATRSAREVLGEVRRWRDQESGEGQVSVSMGLASLDIPPRNFPAAELIAAAERCLQGVQMSGRDGLKTIELC